MLIAIPRWTWLSLPLLAVAFLAGDSPTRAVAQDRHADPEKLLTVDIEVWQFDQHLDREFRPNGNIARWEMIESLQKRVDGIIPPPPKRAELKVAYGQRQHVQMAIDTGSVFEVNLRTEFIGSHEITFNYDLIRKSGVDQVKISGTQRVTLGNICLERVKAPVAAGGEKQAGEWLVLMIPRLRNADGTDVVIPVDLAHEAKTHGSVFFPRAGTFQLQVPEGWSGMLIVNSDSGLVSLAGSTNIGASADARASSKNIPLEIFRAEQPVLEAVSAHGGGGIQVVARRPGSASLRTLLMDVESLSTCELQIVVTADMTEINRAIRDAVPRASVKTVKIKDAVLLSGTVAEAEDLSLLAEIAEQFAPKVINRVKVAGASPPARDPLATSGIASALRSTPSRPAPVEPPGSRPRRRDALELKAIHDEVRGLRDDVRRLNELLQKRLTAETEPQSAEVARINRALGKTVAVDFQETPLNAAIRKLGDLMEVNMVLDTRSLEEGGLKATAPVTIIVTDVTARSALKLILEPMNLTYIVEDEVLKVVSRQRSKGAVIVKTYSFADLRPVLPQDLPGKPQADVFSELRQLMMSTIDPDSWDESGGVGSIQRHRETDSLVVRQSADVHAAIVDLLQQIRRLKGFPPRVDKVDDSNLVVKVYAVADLVVPVPEPKDWKIAGASSWLKLYDRITTDIAPLNWKENGGNCSIEVNENTLSLVIRATPFIHDQIAALFETMRREFDVQVTLELQYFSRVTKAVLQKADLKLDFDPRTRMLQMGEHDTKQLISAIKGSNMGPKITLFNGQIGHIQCGDSKVFLRCLVADNRETVRLNVAVNPSNLAIAMTRNSQRLPDAGYLLIDVTDQQSMPDPATKREGRSLVLVRPRIIVQTEEVMQPDAKSDAGTVTDKASLSDFRRSVGAGLRAIVPIMGPTPIALDWAFPIVKQDTDMTQPFSFSIGVNR